MWNIKPQQKVLRVRMPKGEANGGRNSFLWKVSGSSMEIWVSRGRGWRTHRWWADWPLCLAFILLLNDITLSTSARAGAGTAQGLCLTASHYLTWLQGRLCISPDGDEIGTRDWQEKQRNGCTPALLRIQMFLQCSPAGTLWSNWPSLTHRGTTPVLVLVLPTKQAKHMLW